MFSLSHNFLLIRHVISLHFYTSDLGRTSNKRQCARMGLQDMQCNVVYIIYNRRITLLYSMQDSLNMYKSIAS